MPSEIMNGNRLFVSISNQYTEISRIIFIIAIKRTFLVIHENSNLIRLFLTHKTDDMGNFFKFLLTYNNDLMTQ